MQISIRKRKRRTKKVRARRRKVFRLFKALDNDRYLIIGFVNRYRRGYKPEGLKDADR